MVNPRIALQARCLVVSWTVPPRASGTGIVLQNLFRWVDTNSAVFLGERPLPGMRLSRDPFHHETFFVPMPSWPTRGDRYLRLLMVPLVVAMGVWIAWKYRCKSVVAVFPDESYLLAGYLISLLVGLPLVPYFHDLYLENRREPFWQRLARWLQPRVFRRASVVLEMNDGLAHYHRKRYGVTAHVVGHCINDAAPDHDDPPLPDLCMRIGFSGSIYEPTVDSIRRLIQVVRDRRDFEVHYYSPTGQDYLEREGVWAPNTHLEFIDNREALFQSLRSCDVLYLPLSFSAAGTSTDELMTAFPTKTLEYLVSGRPILVHCPGSYFLARFFREYGGGFLVDSPDPALLLAALERLRTDVRLRRSLVREAKAVARMFDGATVADRFRKLLDSLTGDVSA